MLINLPSETTPCLGRAAELAELRQLLREPGLVTVTGGAGMGKSRLALRSAREGDWAGFDAVCWADLWPVQNDALLSASVADALRLSDHTSRTLVEALCDWLGNRRVLLVLDSCEHLVAATRSLVADLLTVCPRLTVLVTSREALGMAGEAVVELGPLDPAAEGFALFEARATAAGRPLRDTTERQLAQRLSTRLEGVPLALELAAGLLRHRTLQEAWDLTEEKPEALDRQEPGPHPSRHSALRTAVGWSHELCRPVERLLWARLAVFPGSFDADLAALVCLGGPLTADTLREALTGLVRKSVVVLHDGRYRMLDSVRAYGRMWLRELDEEQTVAARHAAAMLDTSRRANEGWLGAEQQNWYARMRDLFHDVCLATRHLIDAEDSTALELIGNTAFFWVCSGHLHEVAYYAQLALEVAPADDPRRVRALWTLGLARILQSDHVTGRTHARASLREAFATGDTEGVRQAAYLEGLAALLDGEPITALSRADEALRAGVPAPRDAADRSAAAPRADPARPTLTFGLMLCGLVRVFALTGAGRLDQARREALAQREVCVDLREYWTRSYLDYQLALIALLEERHREAAGHARDMLDAKQRIGDQFGIAMGLDLLATSWCAQEDPERAVVAIAASDRFWSAVGLLRRGTPEVLPMCALTRARTRALLGSSAYEERVRRAQSMAPESLLHTVLEQQRTR
ncbi:NB-ARC domain-containing protein [Streptomyces sp. NPDC001904]|uniref:ATP-binding protein n=1 Tax=Streptomyces sp. NPDC001904 TaxID=3154531 RepID=UPI00333396C3